VRIAVVADIHANLPAFEAVIADWGAVDEVWCLGDLVGYGPFPNECIARLQSFPYRCLAGNHDWAAIGKISTADFNPEARQAAEWTGRQLLPAHRRFLADLPTTLVVGAFTLVHGSPRAPIWEYVLDPVQAAENFAAFQTPYCFIGHSHIPVVFAERPGQPEADVALPTHGTVVPLGPTRLLLNPGSVGQPRDGDPRASYVLLDTDQQTVTYRRVSYDIARTQAAMRAAGLPARLWLRLAHGW
jgi:diadenosine tetraphosphatase ApaH/serine/threonine PP2A family protein phosphatase